MLGIIAIINCLLLGVCIFFLVTWIFWWLWNMTMPQVFNLNKITCWQAFRLLLIAGIVFGGTYFKFFSVTLAQFGNYL